MKILNNKNWDWLSESRLRPNGLQRSEAGFTLIETFGAITILIFAVLGPLVLLSSNITDGLIVKNQLTAAYLAQEGVELVINQRDRNASLPLPSSPVTNYWLSGMASCLTTIGCNIDPRAADAVGNSNIDYACAGSRGCALVLGDTDGLYHDPYPIAGTSFQDTIFSRKITIEPFNTAGDSIVTDDLDPTFPVNKTYFWDTEGAKVTSTVYWDFKGQPKEYSVSTVIYNLASRPIVTNP